MDAYYLSPYSDMPCGKSDLNGDFINLPTYSRYVGSLQSVLDRDSLLFIFRKLDFFGRFKIRTIGCKIVRYMLAVTS